ncbi:hypothetical protein ABK040_009705 [Willaertia magna]
MNKQHYKVFHFGILAEEQLKTSISNNLFIKKEEGTVINTTSTYYEISIDDVLVACIEKNIWIKKENTNNLISFTLRLLTKTVNHLEYSQQEFTNINDLLQELKIYHSNQKNMNESTIIDKYLKEKKLKFELKEIVTLTTNKERYICLNNNNITLDICKTNICDFYYSHAVLRVPLADNLTDTGLIESISRNVFEDKCPGRSAVIEWLRLAKPNIYNNLLIVNKNENLIKCYTATFTTDEDDNKDDNGFDYFFDPCPGAGVTFNNEEDRLKHAEYLNIQCKITEERRQFLLSKMLSSSEPNANPADKIQDEEDFDYFFDCGC